MVMAWMSYRSYNLFLRRRNNSKCFYRFGLSSSSSSTRTVAAKRMRGGSYRRKYASTTTDTSTRLYSYKDFLEQEDHAKIILSYITDIEGDKFYLDRYVDNSKIVAWTTITSTEKHKEEENNKYAYPFPYDRRIDFVNTNSMLVFGGDLWDKGGFDLYVTRQLLDLKRRYPNRVLWVLGNRDIGKLRILQELGLPPSPPMTLPSSSSSSISVPYHPGLIWFKGSGRVGDPDGPLPPNEPGQRLKWMLGQTMGSPNAMEHRRHELLWEANGCRNVTDEDDDEYISINISDLDVVRSYQESCHPKGEMGLFLSQALLAAPVGPVLIVHGSLPLTNDVMMKAREESKSVWDDLTFCMPWIEKTQQDNNDENENENHQVTTLSTAAASASDHGVEKIEDWFEVVNRFCSENIELWKNDIARLEKEREIINKKQEQNQDGNNDHKERSKDCIWAYRAGYGNGPSYSNRTYSDLIQYGMGRIPGGKKNPAVVYNSFTPEGMPQSFLPSQGQDSDIASSTREFFERSSIQLILSGHKPQGDMPSPIRVDNSSWVVCADTSYSGDTLWFHLDDDDTTTTETCKTMRRQQRRNLGRGNSLSFRGDVAVSEVLVELSKGATTLDSVTYHGVLSDGTKYESINILDADSYSQHHNTSTLIGQVAPDFLVPKNQSPHESGRWWSKSIFRDGSHLYYAAEGYRVWNYFVSSTLTKNNNG